MTWFRPQIAPMAQHRLLREIGGVVYVEFLFAFVPVFVLFLGLVQLALLQAAKATVQQAANAGARAAAVVLPDDPAHYSGTKQGVLRNSQPQATRPKPDENLEGLFGATAPASPSTTTQVSIPGDTERARGPEPSERLVAITRAIGFRLSALAPSVDEIVALAGGDNRQSVARAIGSSHVGRAVMGTTFYNHGVTAISLPRAADGDDLYETRVDPAPELIHVRVMHLYRCAIPLVAGLICKPLSELGISARSGVEKTNQVPPRLTRELQRIPDQGLLRLLAATGNHFFPLRAESAFPYQPARYPYPG